MVFVAVPCPEKRFDFGGSCVIYVLYQKNGTILLLILEFYVPDIDIVESWENKGGQDARDQKEWTAEIFECQLWLTDILPEMMWFGNYLEGVLCVD